MSLFQSSVAILNAGLKAVGGEVVTYRRGNDSITDLVAVPIAVRHDDFGPEETNLTGRELDFAILAADLVCNGERWTPASDDRIDRTVAGVLQTYRLAPRVGDRCYRFTDQTQLQYRVYAVQVLTNRE